MDIWSIIMPLPLGAGGIMLFHIFHMFPYWPSHVTMAVLVFERALVFSLDFNNIGFSYNYTFRTTKLLRGYTGFTPSVRPSVIAAIAIKPPKAACQFAADDILLYKICYNIQWIYFTIWEKGKEELSPLQYHFKSLHIISRHYKKSLLRSQIYHGYEELSTDTNYPIWRRQKSPYMKKTREKKQVCGAACFMAAEIKFSEDVRPPVSAL